MCFIIEQTDHTLKGQQGLWVRENMQILDSGHLQQEKKSARQKLRERNIQKNQFVCIEFFGKYHFGQIVKTIKTRPCFLYLSNILLDKNHKRFGIFFSSRGLFSSIR